MGFEVGVTVLYFLNLPCRFRVNLYLSTVLTAHDASTLTVMQILLFIRTSTLRGTNMMDFLSLAGSNKATS